MGNYIMWIVLGCLIVIVIGFLGFSTLWDKKKRKKAKIYDENIKKEAHLSISKVAIWITSIIFEVNQQIVEFVPSIGRHKMSAINKIAKDELIIVKKSEAFKMILIDKDLHKTFIENIDILIKSKANSWRKNQIKVINFWKNQIGTSLTSDELKKEHTKFEKEVVKKIKKLYE